MAPLIFNVGPTWSCQLDAPSALSPGEKCLGYRLNKEAVNLAADLNTLEKKKSLSAGNRTMIPWSSRSLTRHKTHTLGSVLLHVAKMKECPYRLADRLCTLTQRDDWTICRQTGCLNTHEAVTPVSFLTCLSLTAASKRAPSLLRIFL
jgi:hypothetical protein